VNTFAGVDGCRSGWIVILIPDQVGPRSNRGSKKNRDYRLCPGIEEVAAYTADASLTLIDIPIGLNESGTDERLCDRESRKLLKYPYGSSIYRVPVRPVTENDTLTYSMACSLSRELTGKKLSRQTWNIMPKIRETDRLFTGLPDLQKRMRESHPEVCFWGLSGNTMKHGKREKAGCDERLEALEGFFPGACELSMKILKCTSRKNIQKNDILDALALAVSARISFRKPIKLPLEKSECDRYGLNMEIVVPASRDKIIDRLSG